MVSNGGLVLVWFLTDMETVPDFEVTAPGALTRVLPAILCYPLTYLIRIIECGPAH